MEYVTEPTEGKPKRRFFKDPGFLSLFTIAVYWFGYNPFQKKIVFATSDALAVHPSWLKYLGFIFLIFVSGVIFDARGELSVSNSWDVKTWEEKKKPLFIVGLILFLFCFIAPFFCRSELYDGTVKSRFVIEQLSKDYNLAQAESMQVGFTLITTRSGGKNSASAHLIYEYKAYVSYKFGNKEFKFYNKDFGDQREMISVIEKYKDVLPLELKRKHLDGFVAYNGADESLRMYIKELFEEE
ncbi:MAG: hypothetical protein IKW86_09465 [Salinivirgaceae bacterium]|nr:hypothetical protein [Salinivirgaceae bacterium]